MEGPWLGSGEGDRFLLFDGLFDGFDDMLGGYGIVEGRKGFGLISAHVDEMGDLIDNGSSVGGIGLRMDNGRLEFNPVPIAVPGRPSCSYDFYDDRPWIGAVVVGRETGAKMRQRAVFHRQVDYGDIFLRYRVVVQAR